MEKMADKKTKKGYLKNEILKMDENAQFVGGLRGFTPSAVGDVLIMKLLMDICLKIIN